VHQGHGRMDRVNIPAGLVGDVVPFMLAKFPARCCTYSLFQYMFNEL
jgi:hypothetical protein